MFFVIGGNAACGARNRSNCQAGYASREIGQLTRWCGNHVASKSPPFHRLLPGQHGPAGQERPWPRRPAQCGHYLDGGSWELVAEYTEIETGKRAKSAAAGKCPGSLPAATRHAGHREAGGVQMIAFLSGKPTLSNTDILLG